MKSLGALIIKMKDTNISSLANSVNGAVIYAESNLKTMLTLTNVKLSCENITQNSLLDLAKYVNFNTIKTGAAFYIDSKSTVEIISINNSFTNCIRGN